MNIPLPPSRFSILRPFRAAALAAALLAAPALLVNHASAVTYTWDGETSGELNIATNWVGNVAPVSGNSTDMIIAGTANVTNLYCGGSTGIAYTLRSLTFDATNDANTRFVMVQNANVNNSGRNLTFSSSSGNATLTVEEGSTGNKVIDRTFGGTGSAA